MQKDIMVENMEGRQRIKIEDCAVGVDEFG